MKTYKILVAEDNASLLESIRIRLTHEGYEVLCAPDGYQAVALAREHAPDLLILDVHMPAGDGFSVQERVWNMVNLRRIPVIYMTGDASPNLSSAAHHLGARSLLRKPFAGGELLRLVQRALDQDVVWEDSFAAV